MSSFKIMHPGKINLVFIVCLSKQAQSSDLVKFVSK